MALTLQQRAALMLRLLEREPGDPLVARSVDLPPAIAPTIPPADRTLLRQLVQRLLDDAVAAPVVPIVIGTRYETDRDLTLNEYVVLQLGRARGLPPVHVYDATGTEIFPPIRLVTLDDPGSVGADLTATLGVDPIALLDGSVDVILAPRVLERIGRAGDTAAWLAFWAEAYRVLKPGGRLRFLSPYRTSVWAWSDPGHTREIGEFSFLYLNQDTYRVTPNRSPIVMPYQPACDFVLARWDLFQDRGNPVARQAEAISFIEGVLVARKPFAPYWLDPA